jgi:hypothetical protein
MPLSAIVCLLAAVFLLGAGAAFFFRRHAPGERPRRMALSADDTSCDAPVLHPGDWLGCSGETLTPLRPCGIAAFGRRRHDVRSADGRWVDAGRPVRVSHVRNRKLMVIPDEPDS